MIHPNLHPPLVHFPIALLITGLTIEIFSFLGWRQHPIRMAARWMILLGMLASVAAVTSGIYALNQAARAGIGPQQPADNWRDVVSNSPLVKSNAAWTLMVRHVWLESTGTIALLMTIVCWISCSDLRRQRLAAVWLAGVVIGVGLISGGAYFSGEGVYLHGVGVQSASSAGNDQHRFIDPVEIHLLGAGITIALSALSIGLCCRAATEPDASEFDDLTTTAVRPAALPVPAGKIACIAAIAAFMTALGGWWVLASESDQSVFAAHSLWQLIRDPEQNNQGWLTRRMAHVIAGSAILIVPLGLAISTRWLLRRRLIRITLIALFLLAIAAQVWLGVLLLYDGNSGPVSRFVPAESSQ